MTELISVKIAVQSTYWNGDMAGVVAESLTLPPWNFEFGEMMPRIFARFLRLLFNHVVFTLNRENR